MVFPGVWRFCPSVHRRLHFPDMQGLVGPCDEFQALGSEWDATFHAWEATVFLRALGSPLLSAGREQKPHVSGGRAPASFCMQDSLELSPHRPHVLGSTVLLCWIIVT